MRAVGVVVPVNEFRYGARVDNRVQREKAKEGQDTTARSER